MARTHKALKSVQHRTQIYSVGESVDLSAETADEVMRLEREGFFAPLSPRQPAPPEKPVRK